MINISDFPWIALGILVLVMFIMDVFLVAHIISTSYFNEKENKRRDKEALNPKATKDEEMSLPNKVGKVMKLNCMGEGGIYFSTDRTREWIDPFEINRLNGLLHDLRSANGIFKCVMVVDPMEVLGVDDLRLLMNKRTSCGLSDDLIQFQVNSQLVEDIISIQIYGLMIDHDIPQCIEHAGNHLYIEDILEKDILINGEYKPVIVLITRNMESRYPNDKRLAYAQLSIGLPYCIDMTKTFNKFLYTDSTKEDLKYEPEKRIIYPEDQECRI